MNLFVAVVINNLEAVRSESCAENGSNKRSLQIHELIDQMQSDLNELKRRLNGNNQ